MCFLFVYYQTRSRVFVCARSCACMFVRGTACVRNCAWGGSRLVNFTGLVAQSPEFCHVCRFGHLTAFCGFVTRDCSELLGRGRPMTKRWTGTYPLHIYIIFTLGDILTHFTLFTVYAELGELTGRSQAAIREEDEGDIKTHGRLSMNARFTPSVKSGISCVWHSIDSWQICSLTVKIG